MRKIGSISLYRHILDCEEAIGIGDGEIPDEDITSSSSYDELSLGARGRLGIQYQPPQKSGWCARVNDKNQYLQIDLGKTLIRMRLLVEKNLCNYILYIPTHRPFRDFHFQAP